jgi:RimJ/RimL family protein N-acetyltransferase
MGQGGSVIHGQKVILRPYEEGFSDEELAVLYRWSQDEEVLRWSGGSPRRLTLSDFKREFEQQRMMFRVDRDIFAILTTEGKLIGRIGTFNIDPWERQAEMGIIIGAKEHWNQGYGTDAVITLLRHIFTATDVERIYLFTYTENRRAQRCFARCGFRRIGTGRRLFLDRGSRLETEMEIWRDEFESLSAQREEGTHELHPQHGR